jgi:NADPH:quinone reductase-like Zn-dependent oxidoreductase
VTQLQSGDEVFGWCDGSFAEYASVPEGQLARKPANLSFEQAAAVPISGFAALQALRDTGQVQTGQKVVVETGQRADGQFKVLRLTSDTSFAAEFAAERDLIGSQLTNA